MQIGAQVSLYPLGQADLLPAIQDIWDVLREAGLAVEPGPLSTLVYGEEEAVLRALGEGFRRATARGPAVLVITLSNACPIPGEGKSQA